MTAFRYREDPRSLGGSPPRIKTYLRACAAAVLGAAFAIPAFAGDAPAPSSPESPSREKKRPLVVLRQVQILGRVFILGEEEQQSSATNLHVQVSSLDGDKRVWKTDTDGEGVFRLPRLDVGTYRLTIGRLELTLKVEDPPDSEAARLVPKRILVFMPEELRN